MVSITFYGGVKEIGGNKVLLEDDELCVFLDFGFSFQRYGRFYEEYLKPRSSTGLLDLLATDLIPPLIGAYREDLLTKEVKALLRSHPFSREASEVQAVLISHAHLDHCGHVGLLAPEIPATCSITTAFIMKAAQDIGRPDFDKRICYYAPAEHSRPSGWVCNGLVTYQRTPFVQRQFYVTDLESVRPAPSAEKFWVNVPKNKDVHRRSLRAFNSDRMKAFPVDHSVPGSVAWAIQTEAGWVVYTGDFRFHGRAAGCTEAFIEEAAKLQPTAVIIEGTRIDDEFTITELEVQQNLLSVVRRSEGKLVIADFGPRNVERLLSFLEVARETDRQLVLSPKDAYLLKALRLLDPEFPDIGSDANLLIYQKPTGRPSPDRWLRNLYTQYKSKIVLADTIHRQPGEFILCFGLFDLNELPSLPRKGVYIYSSSEPHDEEDIIDFRRLQHWLQHFEFTAFGLPAEIAPGCWRVPEEQKGLHASGHASGPELIRTIIDIGPKVVLPIHSEAPERFRQPLQKAGIEVILPKEGVPVRL